MNPSFTVIMPCGIGRRSVRFINLSKSRSQIWFDPFDAAVTSIPPIIKLAMMDHSTSTLFAKAENKYPAKADKITENESLNFVNTKYARYFCLRDMLVLRAIV